MKSVATQKGWVQNFFPQWPQENNQWGSQKRMHIGGNPLELIVSMNFSSVCGFAFCQRPGVFHGTLGREHGGALVGGHDTLNCKTTRCGHLADLGQACTGVGERGWATLWNLLLGRIMMTWVQNESKVHGHKIISWPLYNLRWSQGRRNQNHKEWT